MVEALRLSCPPPLLVPATTASGASVSFVAPMVSGGRAPFTTTCSHQTGQQFPTGRTTVSCTVRDGTSATASCSFDVTVEPIPRLSRTRFLAFGDSMTAGEVSLPRVTGAQHGAITPSVVTPAVSYPTVLGVSLARRYALQAVTVVNAGQPGQWAADAVPRFLAALSTNQPEVVLLLMGTNDLNTTSTTNAGVAALDRMAKEARGRGARVFLATLPPSLPGGPRTPPLQLQLTFNAGVRSLAAGEGAVLVDLNALMAAEAQTWIGSDGLHPTEAGYARMAELFFDAIRANLEVR